MNTTSLALFCSLTIISSNVARVEIHVSRVCITLLERVFGCAFFKGASKLTKMAGHVLYTQI